MLSNIEMNLNEYYLNKLITQLNDESLANKRIPLKIAIASAVEKYITSEGFKIFCLDNVYVEDNNTVVFKYKLENMHDYCLAYLKIDKYNASINKIIISKKDEGPTEERIGNFLKSYDTKIYTNTKYANLRIDYKLNIGKELNGAMIIKDKNNEFKMFLTGNTSIYHYMTADKDFEDKNIGLELYFSIGIV